jgi:hypothetical protein
LLRKQNADIEFHNRNMQAMTIEMKSLFEKAVKEKKNRNDGEQDILPFYAGKPQKTEQKREGMFPLIIQPERVKPMSGTSERSMRAIRPMVP